MSENFNEQNENNQNEYGTSQNIYGNTQIHTVIPRIHMAVKTTMEVHKTVTAVRKIHMAITISHSISPGWKISSRSLCTDECWTVDADLFIGEHSNCKYRYVYYLADRKNPKDAIRKNWARGQLFMGLIIFGIMLIFTIIALTVSTLVGGSSSGSSKIDTGVTSDYMQR